MNGVAKDKFRDLFLQALRRARTQAELLLNGPVKTDFLIELHAPGRPGRVSVELALDALYLGPDRFYKIIDIAPRAITERGWVMFARVSGHQPASFAETFDPGDLGPFKLLEAMSITDERRAQSH